MYFLIPYVFSVHLRQEEKLVVRMGRDGGVQQLELLGLVTLHIGDEKWGRIRVQLENKDIRGVQLQVILIEIKLKHMIPNRLFVF